MKCSRSGQANQFNNLLHETDCPLLLPRVALLPSTLQTKPSRRHRRENPGIRVLLRLTLSKQRSDESGNPPEETGSYLKQPNQPYSLSIRFLRAVQFIHTKLNRWGPRMLRD